MMKLLVLLASLVVFPAALLAETAAPAKPEVPPSVLKKYDRNKNGVLDEPERAKWQADLAKRREAYQKERAEMLARFDTNKDGKLSADEAAAAKIEMSKARTEQDMIKGKEKAEERLAREAADKELQEKLAAAKAAEANVAEPGAMMMME